MRSLLESICWMPPMDFYKIITLMLFLTLVLLFHFSVLRLESRNMFLFLLDHRPLIRLVNLYLFQLVLHLRQLKLFWVLINHLQWTIFHLFIVHPNRMPRKLKLLDLMSVIFPLVNKLEVKSNMPTLHYWLMYLKILIMLPTQMLKDDQNGNMLCKKQLILCQWITLGNYFLDNKEIMLWSVNGFIGPNFPLKVLLRNLNLTFLRRDFLNKKVLTTLIPLPMLQR